MVDCSITLGASSETASLHTRRHRFLKRALDLLIALPALFFLAPMWVALSVCIRATSPGSALFRQRRVGLRGKEFVLLKFRTMHLAPDNKHRDYVRLWMRAGETARQANGEFKLSTDGRITPIGGFLRKYSLDELPQLVNVIRGEMSLVGPRPAIPYEVAEYEPWQRERLQVPPGLTGLWQVSGRNHLSFDEMVALDLKYVRSPSLLNDVSILLRTIPTVVRGTGH